MSRIFRLELACLLVIAVARPAIAESLEFRGFSEPYRNISVAAPEVGRVERMEVQVGDVVSAGQALAGLDDAVQVSLLEIARQQAEAEGSLAAATAERNLHRIRIDRLRQLAEEGHARPDEILRAEADLAIAEARLRQVQEDRAVRQLEVHRYQMQVDRRVVRAPVAGVISEVFKQPGEFVSPADPYVVRMIQVDPVMAVFHLPPAVASRLSADREVRVRIGKARTTRGKVDSVAPEIDAESGVVEVRVRVENPQGAFKAGDDCSLVLAEG